MDNLTNKRIMAAVKNVAKWTYIVGAIILVCGGAYYLYNVMNRPVAGILFFIASLLAAYFYYVKWFIIPAQNPSWPPYQTVCPDFLTPISPGYDMKDGKPVPKAGGKFKCVDFVGVSRNARLKRASPESLQTQLNNPDYTFEIDPKESRSNLKTRVESYGLSWITMFGDN